MGRFFKSIGAEYIQEGFTEALTIGYETGVLDKEMTWGEAWKRIRHAASVGAGVGGSLAVATHPFTRGEAATTDALEGETDPDAPIDTSEFGDAAEDVIGPDPDLDISGFEPVEIAATSEEGLTVAPEVNLDISGFDPVEEAPPAETVEAEPLEIDQKKGFTKPKERTKARTAVDIIRELGGIVPSGETRSADLHKKLPGLVRGADKGGRTEHEIREHLEQVGMLPEGSHDAAIYDLIDNPNVTHPKDQALVDAKQVADAEKGNEAFTEQTKADVAKIATEYDETFDENDTKAVLEVMADRNVDAETATDMYIERLAIQAVDVIAEDTADYSYKVEPDIPFETEPHQAGSQPGKGPEGRPDKTGDQGKSQEGAQVAEDVASPESEEVSDAPAPLTEDEQHQFITDIRTGDKTLDSLPVNLFPLAAERFHTTLPKDLSVEGELEFLKKALADSDDKTTKGALEAVGSELGLTVPEQDEYFKTNPKKYYPLGEDGSAFYSIKELKDYAANKKKPAAEQTDQGEQTLIEGVAPVTDKDRVEAQSKRPLKSKKAQKDADEGLFDVEGRKQSDLLDKRADAGSFQLQNIKPRKQGIPKEADPPISSYTKDADIKSHADYVAAKSGDVEAAGRLIPDLVKPKTLVEARRRFGPDVFYTPIIAKEATGHNAIPEVAATYYAEKTGADVAGSIFQVSQAFHTGARPMERIISRPVFSGQVDEGKKYVLVDDVTVLGGTIAEMANYIQENGGEVAGVVTLVNAGRNVILRPKINHIRILEKRFGDEIRSIGIEPAALTANEAQYLVGYKDADGIRAAIAKAESERESRLRKKAVRQEEDGSLKTSAPKPSLSNVQFIYSDEFQEKRAKVHKDLRAALDRVGLKNVELNIPDIIEVIQEGRKTGEATGHYLERVMHVALSSTDAKRTLNHEIIHALRQLGLFTEKEWSTLVRAAKAQWMKQYNIKKRYPGLSVERQIEEAIAEAHGGWRGGESQIGGPIKRAFIKIVQFIKALANALKKNGFQTVGDVFKRIESGEIGSRQAEEVRGDQAMFQREEIVSTGPDGRTSRFEATIEGWKAAINHLQKHPGNKPVSLGRAFYVLREMQVQDRRIVMRPRVVNAVLKKHPEIPQSVWDRLPEHIADPLYIYTHKDGGVNVVIDAKTKDGLPIVVGIRDGEIRTITPRDGINNALAAAVKRGKKIYAKNGKIPTEVLQLIGIKDRGRGPKGHPRMGTRPNILNRDDVIKSQGRIYFQLSENTPDTNENRQLATQNLISKGQPLDRAMRVPFDWFGGVTEDGRWAPSLNLTKKAGDIIRNAKFSEDGIFSWVNPGLYAARAGLIDRYGLAPEYVKRDRRRDLDKRGIATTGVEILKVLQNENIGTEEAKVLQAVLTGEGVAETDMAKISAPILEAIDELGAEAVSLGLVSAESFERNRGTYLHRVYMKNEIDQNKLTRWTSKYMGKKRKQIQGDALKGRGIFNEIATGRVMKDIASFKEAKRGAPVKGEKFVILDDIPDQGALSGVEPSQPKARRRVFLPADETVPEKYQDFTDQGEWEVRAVGKNKIVLWRDYTKDERTNMGEIIDARYTIGKTFSLMANDLATGRFYKDISENSEWTLNTTPNAKWVNATEFRRHWGDETIEWVKVPDTDIAQTGGKKRWGALAGKYVRSEIWRDLNELDIMGRPNTWTQLLTQWKKNKTGRSPVVHMNNVMSNMLFMDMADVRVQDLIKGISAYVNETADYKEAQENGAFGSDVISQEMKREIFDPILEDLQKEMSGGRNPVTAKWGTVGKIVEAIYDKWKTLDNGMLRLYQAEDEAFRMAMYMRRRNLGSNAEDAAAEARTQFLDYDIRAPWVNAARRSVLPFISYTYRAVPVITKSLAQRPWKIAKYTLVASLASTLAYMVADGDEDEERRSLRKEEGGMTWLSIPGTKVGIPRMQRMPYRDEHGNPVFLDIRRWIPAGDVFDMGQNHGAFPIPAPLQFGGPLMLAMEALFNKSAFTGQEITNDLTDTAADKAGKIAGHVWKSWMPSAVWVPHSWYWDKVGKAAKGATDSQGRAYSVPGAVLSSFGIKLKPQDVEQNLDRRAYDFKKERNKITQLEKTLGRQLERNIVTEEVYEKEMKSLERKRDLVDKREAEIFPNP